MKKVWLGMQMLAFDVVMFFPAHHIYELIGGH